MSRAEEAIRRLADAEPQLSDRELTRMARTAAGTQRVPPRPGRRAGATRATAVAAAVAAIGSAGITGSVLGWTHGSASHSTSIGLSLPDVQFSALALLKDGSRR